MDQSNLNPCVAIIGRPNVGKSTLFNLLVGIRSSIVSDEYGNTVEKETPKNEFLKTLTMFFFDNKTNNSDLDWLQYGMPAACYYTLQQEKLIVMYEPHGNYEYFGNRPRARILP